MSATESSRGSSGDQSVKRKRLGAGKGKLIWTMDVFVLIKGDIGRVEG